MVNSQYALIGVEGNHDQAFVGKVLYTLLGFRKYNGEQSQLDPFWRKFIPRYPLRSNFYKRLDMPSIFFTENLSVAIYVGEGSELINNLALKFDDEQDFPIHLSAFGIVADADRKTPNQVAEPYYNGFHKYFPNLPSQAGVVSIDPIRTGIYILPNNSSQGVLDTLLCSCGQVAYPTYMERASSYIAQFSDEERRSLRWGQNSFDYDKALIATVVSVLKPGKTNTVSITDNNWISSQTEMQVPELAKFVSFLQQLLGLENSL